MNSTNNPDSKPRERAVTPPRVLVVDDESETLLQLFDLLTAAGYFVEGSSNSLDALGLIRRRPYDVVLVDVHMPEMGGLELFGRIRHLSPQTRVLLMSAFTDQLVRNEAERKGAAAFLQKPVRGEELLATMSRFLRGVGVGEAGVPHISV